MAVERQAQSDYLSLYTTLKCALSDERNFMVYLPDDECYPLDYSKNGWEFHGLPW
jgi:hypothetical protein